ncbi:hypothetical protein [Rhodophyticola porphyridii]|uniref:hypothetical protein n=1 Tax=Rhodophyticola porphyridii TaxID=1852017 RepID=UPI0035CF274D
MARRVLFWGLGLVILGAATAGLLYFATAGATVFRVEGDRMYMSGPMTGASPERFEMLVEQNPGLRTVVLGDMPGAADITALLQNGYRIRRLGLTTEVAPGARIEGDAVWLVLAGAGRQIGAGAEIVISDWGGAALAEDDVAHEERRRYVTDMLGGDAFYRATLDAGAEGRLLTGEDFSRFGLVTGG